MRPNVFRAAVGACVLFLCALIAVYISVSLVDVQVAAYIQGPATLRQGAPNAIRGFIMNAPTGQLFSGARTRFVLNPGAGQVVIGDGETQPHGYVHTTLDVSTASVGQHTVKLTATHPLIDDFEADAQVDVGPAHTPALPTFSSRAPDNLEKPTPRAWTGALRVEPMAETPELVRGLPNLLALRVVGVDGAPVAATVEVLKQEGPLEGEVPTEWHTDAFGVTSVRVKPVGGFRWTLRATSVGIEPPLEGEGTLGFYTVPAQFSLEMTQNFLEPGGKAEGHVTTLYQSGGLMVDLWGDDRWVFADAFRISPSGAGLRVEAPKSARPRLWRVQVYDDVFAPGKAWDARWMAVSPDGRCRRAIDPTLDVLGEFARHRTWVDALRRVMAGAAPMTEAQCNLLLGSLLQGVPTHFEEAHLIFNSKAKAEQDLEAWKAEVKSWLHALIAVALLLAFVVVLVFVAQGVATAQVQRRMLQDVDLELAGDGRVDSAWDRIAHHGRIVLLVGTIALFCAGLLMVLKFM